MSPLSRRASAAELAAAEAGKGIKWLECTERMFLRLLSLGVFGRDRGYDMVSQLPADVSVVDVQWERPESKVVLYFASAEWPQVVEGSTLEMLPYPLVFVSRVGLLDPLQIAYAKNREGAWLPIFLMAGGELDESRLVAWRESAARGAYWTSEVEIRETTGRSLREGAS